MTSLFATGYGIYKGYYDDLTDIQFGEMFSAGIAESVRAFKTSGSGMAQGIQSLGASATTANVPLEEQLAILGMLQATMGGAEAGTKPSSVQRRRAARHWASPSLTPTISSRSVLVDERGLPLAIVLSGANTHDIKLLEETLDHIVVLRPEPDEEHPQNLCLDAGYTSSTL